jgi:lipopolysaccharide transport system permease protein
MLRIFGESELAAPCFSSIFYTLASLLSLKTNMQLKIPADLKIRLERIYLFANTDYYARYYGAKLGILWAFLNPFFQIMIYYITFSYLIFRQRDPEFVLYLFTGIITWQFFGETTKTSINLFMQKRFILQNMGLPKVDFFWALVGSKFWGYLINFGIYLVFSLLFFSPEYSWKLLLLIPIWVGLIAFTVGVTFFLATFYIYLRDLKHLWAVIMLAGFWMMPIIWDYKILYDTYSFLLYFPLTTYFVNIREVTLHNQLPDLQIMFTSIFNSILLAIAGYYYMKTHSKKALEFL